MNIEIIIKSKPDNKNLKKFCFDSDFVNLKNNCLSFDCFLKIKFLSIGNRFFDFINSYIFVKLNTVNFVGEFKIRLTNSFVVDAPIKHIGKLLSEF